MPVPATMVANPPACTQGFKWRDRKGELIRPDEMPTKRLFYTWLMIWNHAVPKHMRMWHTHRYVFDRSIYTPQYMFKAFSALSVELYRRGDIGSKMQEVMNQVENIYTEYLLRRDTPTYGAWQQLSMSAEQEDDAYDV